MWTLVKAGLIGLGVAGLGVSLALTPWGAALEERVGLAGLFRVRGPLEPPADVVVVSLDRSSAEAMGLPEPIRDWPRSIHARLIERLVEAGASVIVFDLILSRPQDPAEDLALARAVAQARRVVLFEYLDSVRRPLAEAGPSAPQEWLTTERAIEPLPAFAESAVGLAPFPLPKVPNRVSQFWTFQQLAGERPTLPVVALQHHAVSVYRPWSALLKEQLAGRLDPWPDDPATIGAREWRRLMVDVRHAFRADPALAERLARRVQAAADSARDQRLLDALIDVYGGEDSRYLNFYGPAGQVPTVALHDLLRPAADARTRAVPDLDGSAVFVGRSELISHLDDDFTTVFSRPDGIDLSGVEIAATAFANLRDGRTLDPLGFGSRLAVLGAFGLAVGLIAASLPALLAVTLCLALAVAYAASAQIAFGRADLWLPVAIPLLVQLPLGLFAGLLMQYRYSQRARAHISRGIRYYLPEQIAAGLAEAPFDPAALNQRVYATCMVSDIEGFTSLAETMPPEVLKPLLDSYLEILIGAVKRRHGSVTDIVGDGTTCVWMPPAPGPNCHVHACAAALDIERAVAAFNRTHGPPGLPTRIGLHAGWVVVGNVGGEGRFAYSVLGDTVNTASRIEQLNKQLGTYLLATDAVTAGLGEYLVRPLGRFRLVGKTEALRLGELRGRADEPHDARLLAAFAQALAAFEGEHWEDAARGFERVLTDHPEDGPARFYLHWCRRYLARPTLPADPTVIHLEQK